MKAFKTFVIFFVLIVTLTQCNDENTITNAYKGEKELKEGDSIPFILRQNYPNPFNPTTRIHFQLYVEMKINLSVYTEDWIKVETLIDRTLTPTSIPSAFEYRFEPKDIPSGEYYYVLKGGGYTQIRKMKLVK